MATLSHRDGRGSHQQIHDAVAQRSDGHRHKEFRLLHQLPGAATRQACGGLFELRELDAGHQQQTEQADTGQGRIRADKGYTGKLLRHSRQIRAGNTADNSARQYPGNGP